MVRNSKYQARNVTVEHQEHTFVVEHRDTRIYLALRFLDEVILPQIRACSIEDPADILELYGLFRLDNCKTADFELAHTWQLAALREYQNSCIAKTNLSALPDDAAEVAIAEFLLDQAVKLGIV
jgi:hypothetical protein